MAASAPTAATLLPVCVIPERAGQPHASWGGLLEHEVAERAKRRIERHRVESQLDPTKTLASFEFTEVPMLSKAHVMALASGDSWLDKGATVLIFGPLGAGKSHIGSPPSADVRTGKKALETSYPNRITALGG